MEQITKQAVIDTMAGVVVTLYIDKMATNMEGRDTENPRVSHLRYSIYKLLMSAIQEHTLSIEMLQQQVDEWKSIKTIKDIPLLLPNAEVDELTKEDLKAVKQVIKELDKMTTFVVSELGRLYDKCITLADKHEVPQERLVEN